MHSPWQFSLSTLMRLVVVSSIGIALTAQFGPAGIILLCLGGALWVGIAGCVRREPGWAIGGFSTFILLFMLSIPFSSYSIWDGHKNVPLKFIVVDATSQQPIAGATIWLRATQFSPFTPSVTGASRATGASRSDGSVTLTWDFPASGRDGFLEHTGHVLFEVSRVSVVASASGYSTETVPLESLTGNMRDISDPLPPPMQIPLKRATLKP